MTDKTQPEALRLADELAQRWGENMACPELEAAAELRRQHARIAELEAQLEAVGAGGVRALSAAPAEVIKWPKDAKEVREFMHTHCITEQYAVGIESPSDDDKYLLSAHDFLSAVNWWADFPHYQAASPTPPAERQIKKPNVVLELPDGDDRVAKVFFSEMKGDTLHLCITVTEQAAPKAAPGEQDLASIEQEIAETCMNTPPGWRCTRKAGHDGPCAAVSCPEDLEFVASGMERIRKAEAAPQQEPAGEVVSASCDHATVRWLHQTSSVGGGDPRNSRSWPITGAKVYLAPQQEAQEPGWDGAEEWEKLAWHLCAEDNGEDACNDLIWEGGPMPEPWGDRWLKYEGEARRMIALVRTHVPAPQQEAQEPCPSCRNSDIYACTCPFPTLRNAAPQPAPAPLSEREAFEAKFGVPGGVRWDVDGYVVNDDYLNSYLCNRFVGQWKAWQARAALAAQGGRDAG